MAGGQSKKTVAWAALCLALLLVVPCSVAFPGCHFEGKNGYCSEVTGKDILNNTDVLMLSVDNSDLSLLTADDFARFRPLAALSVDNCTLPRAGGRPLSALSRLQELTVTCAGPQGEQELGALVGDAKELRSLIMHHCGLRRVDAALVGQLPHLRMLDLRHNAVERVDAAALAALRELRLLRLEHNQLSEAQALEGLSVKVRLDGNPLCDARPPGGEDAFLEEACLPEDQWLAPPLEEAGNEEGEREKKDADKEEEEEGKEAGKQEKGEREERDATTSAAPLEEQQHLVEEKQQVVEKQLHAATTTSAPLQGHQEPPGLMRAKKPSPWAMDGASFWVGVTSALAICVTGVVVVVVVRKRNIAAAKGDSSAPQPPAAAEPLVGAAQKSAAGQEQ